MIVWDPRIIFKFSSSS